jgi:hypothetical protein
LDDLNLSKFDYVKLDCEGYEFNIVRGGENCLKEYRPVIVVEQKFHKDTGITDNGETVALLQSWGARIVEQVRNDVIMGW